eukprot:gene22599-23807_t
MSGFDLTFASSVMQDKYSPAEVEQSAQQHWISSNAYKTVEHAKDRNGKDKKKFYA